MNFDGLQDHIRNQPLLPNLSEKQPIIRMLSTGSLKGDLFKHNSEKLPSIRASPLRSPRYKEINRHQQETPRIAPTKISTIKCGKVRVYAANTTIGLSRFRNEDRARIIVNIKKPSNFSEEKWPQSSFYGLYTGHGGKECSEYLKEKLHNYIFAENNFPFRPKYAIKNAFHQVDQEYLISAEDNNDLSGSSALICLLIGNKCFIGNTGDSRAILSITQGSKILQLTQDHNSLNESEANRVILEGGKLISNFILQQGIRIDRGPNRIIPGNLSVSRSFGYFSAKLEKFGGNPRVVIVDPFVTSFSILNEYDFIIICSASIITRLSNQDIIDCVWKGFSKCLKNDLEAKILTGINEVLNEAKYRRIEENLTVIFIGFKSLQALCSTEYKWKIS